MPAWTGSGSNSPTVGRQKSSRGTGRRWNFTGSTRRTATESEWEETATDSEWPKGYVLEQRGDPKLEGWLALSWGSGRTRKAAGVRAADQEDVLELSWTGEDTAREIYQYEDEQIAVTAIPESPEALPGPVWLQVTEVNPNTEG